MSKIVQETNVFLKCDCHCARVVFDKTVWDDGEIDFNISVQDSRYDHSNTTLLGRIKSALKLLFGKPVYYSDVFIDEPEKFIEFVRKLNELCEGTSAVQPEAKEEAGLKNA